MGWRDAQVHCVKDSDAMNWQLADYCKSAIEKPEWLDEAGCFTGVVASG
jgi:hypothetical protein